MNPGAFKERVTRVRENVRRIFDDSRLGTGPEFAFAKVPGSGIPRSFQKPLPSTILTEDEGPGSYAGTQRTIEIFRPIEVDRVAECPTDYSRGVRPDKAFARAVEKAYENSRLKPGFDFTNNNVPRSLIGFRHALESISLEWRRYAVAIISSTLPIDLIDALCDRLEKDIQAPKPEGDVKLAIIEAIRAIGEFRRLKDAEMDGTTKDKLLQRMMGVLCKVLSLDGNATLKIEALESMMRIMASSSDISNSRPAGKFKHHGNGNEDDFNKGLDIALKDPYSSVKAMAAYVITRRVGEEGGTNVGYSRLLKEAAMREACGDLGTMMLYAGYAAAGPWHMGLEDIVRKNHGFKGPDFVNTGQRNEDSYMWTVVSGIAYAFPVSEHSFRKFDNLMLLGEMALDEGVDRKVRFRCIECLGMVRQIGERETITSDELVWRVKTLSRISESEDGGIKEMAEKEIRNILDAQKNGVEKVSYGELRELHAEAVYKLAARLIQPEFGRPALRSGESSR